MIIREGMNPLRVSLKGECQQMMRMIIRHQTSHPKQLMNSDKLFQIQFPQHIHKNLDQQTQAFQLFFSDPWSGHHWITKLIHQLPKQPYINQSQFFDLLRNDNSDTNNLEVKYEDIITSFDGRFKEYQFFNEIPPYAFLISSIEQISKSAVLFTVRNFQGQILFLSINPSHEKKITILFKFCQKFNSQVVHVLLDAIDYESSPNTQLSVKELEELCKKIDLIYLRRQFDKNELNDRDDMHVRYLINYNSLFQKYYRGQQLSSFKNNIISTIQKLLKYFFELNKEELTQFTQVYYEELPLLKSILKINYNRTLQNTNENQQEYQNFLDFINTQIYIYQQIRKNTQSIQTMHLPRNITPPEMCLQCENQKHLQRYTSFQCSGCHQQDNINTPLCAECFQPYHAWRERLTQGQFVNFQRNSIKSQKITNKHADEKQFKNNHPFMLHPNQIQRIDERNEKQNLKKKQNSKCSPFSNISQTEIKQITQLQQSAQRLFGLFKELKMSKTFYKPLYSNPANQKQFEQELQNQSDFMKTIDNEVRKQIEMFQGQILISIYDQKQEEQRKLIENSNKLVKFQNMQQNNGQQHSYHLMNQDESEEINSKNYENRYDESS